MSRYRDGFSDVDEPTVVLGHTHMPFDRLADRRRFVNPGSVGMPYGRAGAHWALLGPGVALRRADYDAEAAAETFRPCAPDYPGLAEFIEENVLTVPSGRRGPGRLLRLGRARRGTTTPAVARRERAAWSGGPSRTIALTGVGPC